MYINIGSFEEEEVDPERPPGCFSGWFFGQGPAPSEVGKYSQINWVNLESPIPIDRQILKSCKGFQSLLINSL